MRFVRRIRQVVTVVCIVVYLLATGIPHASPTNIAQAAGSLTISGFVTVNGQAVWDGFGVKITGSRGTTMWAETRGGWYQFTGFSSGTYTIGHNSSCTPNGQQINISGNTRFDIGLTCQTYTLGGYVNINGKPAWKGFGVKATLGNWSTKWGEVVTDDGWYEFKGSNALIAGNYIIHHNHNCSSTTPVGISIPATNNRGPDINIECPTYTLNGYVKINGVPAWKGFGVKATLGDGTTLWAKVETDDGWYEFRDASRLIEGNYVISHNHSCPSNAPIPIGIPATNNRGPDIYLDCPTYPLHGKVYVNGEPTWKGFGVKATINGWMTKWIQTQGDDGYYEFAGGNGLLEADYVIHHNHPCESNTPAGIHVPAANNQGPDIYITCPDAKHPLYGYVTVNGRPAWKGFGVAAVRKNGSTKWVLTDATGRYEFSGDDILTEGEYTIRHNHNCPSNNDVTVWIPSNGNRGPDFDIRCPAYSLYGYVTIDGVPAWKDFGVKASLKDGTTVWALTDENGRYEFKGDVSLIEADYTIHHNHPCPSDSPTNVHVPSTGNRGPDIHLMCEANLQKYDVSGIVTIDGKPAHQGFGVNIDGIGWVLVDNNEGRYRFVDVPKGTYSVSHAYNICPTIEGNPQYFRVDGRTGPNFTIVCPHADPVPPIIIVPPDDEPTCNEILDGLGINRTTIAATSPVQEQAEIQYLPLVIMTDKQNVSSPSYVMDEETFVRLAKQLDEMTQFITSTTVLSSTVLIFDHSMARGAGYSEDLIDLTNQIMLFENKLLQKNEPLTAASVQPDTVDSPYPLLDEYLAAATRYANTPRAAAVEEEVRGLSIEECVCGSVLYPRPSHSADRKFFVFETEVDAYRYMQEQGFHDSQIPHAGWSRPQTWQSDLCGIETYRDDAVAYASPTFPGKWTVAVQNYESISPRGEPNPEVTIHGGVANWPYPSWITYVIWWHDNF